MDKEKKKFNKKEYDKAYINANCKRKEILFKIKDYEDIISYCKDMNLSFSEYVKMCCKYCLDNVHIDELKHYKK